MNGSNHSCRGFTLIEIVVFMILLGVFSVSLVQFVRTSTQSSVVAVNWLRDEAGLQGMMEDIVAEYKRVVTETAEDSVTLQSDLIDLKAYAESTWGSHVVAAETGYITFGANGTASWPPENTIPGQEPVLIVTLQNGLQRVSSLFMASQ